MLAARVQALCLVLGAQSHSRARGHGGAHASLPAGQAVQALCAALKVLVEPYGGAEMQAFSQVAQ